MFFNMIKFYHPFQTQRRFLALPPEDGHDFGLSFTIGVLAFLSCVSIMISLVADRTIRHWTGSLGTAVTVQIKPKHGETGAEAADRAAEILAGVKGVSEARAWDRKTTEALLEPWLGKGNIPQDLPLPQLVTLELDKHHPAKISDLKQALSAVDIQGDIDDHSHWMGEIITAGRWIRLAALLACSLTTGAAVSVIAFATRQGLALRRDIIEVLHLCGADDHFVAGLFQVRFGYLTFQASLLGVIMAAVLAGLSHFLTGKNSPIPLPSIGLYDVLICVLVPCFGGAFAAITAKHVAMKLLRHSL